MTNGSITVTVFPLDESTRSGDAIADGSFSTKEAALVWIAENFNQWHREAREYLITSGAEQADVGATPTIDITVGFWS